MNERVRLLREQSVNAIPSISAERAQIITDFQKHAGLLSAPMKRALSFKAIVERKDICINKGELIVGERGPAPKATYTYPEICCHSIEDLDILNSREKISYKVDSKTRAIYESEIVPYWKGRTVREKIFEEMTPDWKDSFSAGIFTEFLEQRTPGHTVLDGKIYSKGMLAFKRDIQNAIEGLDFFNDPEALPKKEELSAMSICADALIKLSERHADKLSELAASEQDPVRRSELLRMESVCRHIPANAPRDMWEALQYYWFVHLGVVTELNPWDSFNPGRLDQHLYPFYKKGLADGTLTKESARELLQCFWIKFNNQPAPPKVGVTAAESSTYTDFANINSGGLMIDGSNGVNEMTFLVLDVIDEMALVQPSSNIQLSSKNPDEFLLKACDVIKHGRGQPSIFNADVVIEEMLRQGKTIEDARCGGTSGCVETGAFGKEAYILTGYFNLPKVLEITLNNGVDPRTGKKIGVETGDPEAFGSLELLLSAFRIQLNHFIDIKMRGNNVIERIYMDNMPVPFLSIVIDDCIQKGRDYNSGGARYNTNYFQGVGIGTITDSLSAIKTHVFESKTLSMKELIALLKSNFAGDENKRLLLMNKTPKYGNDDDRADSIMVKVFDLFYDSVNGRDTVRGGKYRIQMLPTTCHVYFGSVIGATPDGRMARAPLSEGISPVQGADRNGPTSVIKSASKMDHVRTGGTLLNQKFTPSLLETAKGMESMGHLVRTYFTLGGHHIQFNVVNADMLREAQKNPENYRDLIVRVAGYSDYFCHLGKALQDEIIERTEHRAF